MGRQIRWIDRLNGYIRLMDIDYMGMQIVDRLDGQVDILDQMGRQIRWEIYKMGRQFRWLDRLDEQIDYMGRQIRWEDRLD